VALTETIQQNRHFLGGIFPIIGGDNGMNAMMRKQRLGRLGIFGGDQINLSKRRNGSNREIIRMPDGYTDDE
jgi:hypothetical protein